MNKYFTQFRLIFFAGCVAAFSLAIGLVIFSETTTDATKTESKTKNIPIAETSAIVPTNKDFLESVRLAYADVTSVDMQSEVSIKIFRDGGVVSGDAVIRYLAKGDKYKCEVTIPEILAKAGLMRSLTLSWNGRRYYMLDPEADVISFQSQETRHLASALPNPFFLPVEFLSSNDDDCVNCPLRLQDLKRPERWSERQADLRIIQSDKTDGLIHDVLKVPGGKIHGQAFEFMVRVVGQSGGARQINSISITAVDGRNMADLVFAKFSSIDGLTVKAPLEMSFLARNEKGQSEFTADFRISKLVLNRPLADTNFDIDFDLAGRVWDSDARSFVKNSP